MMHFRWADVVMLKIKQRFRRCGISLDPRSSFYSWGPVIGLLIHSVHETASLSVLVLLCYKSGKRLEWFNLPACMACTTPMKLSPLHSGVTPDAITQAVWPNFIADAIFFSMI